MSKISLGRNAFIYPMPVVLVGSMAGDRANFMTVAWVSRVNVSPPMVAVAIGKPHYTTEFIRKNKAFSINVPGTKLKDKVDYCGLVSGEKVDKSALFEIFYGELKVPMIKECTLSLECKLAEVVELPTNNVFIGEIINSYADEQCLADGKLDLQKMEPLLLTMPDNRYWTAGEAVGRAWHDGMALKKK